MKQKFLLHKPITSIFIATSCINYCNDFNVIATIVFVAIDILFLVVPFDTYVHKKTKRTLSKKCHLIGSLKVRIVSIRSCDEFVLVKVINLGIWTKIIEKVKEKSFNFFGGNCNSAAASSSKWEKKIWAICLDFLDKERRGQSFQKVWYKCGWISFGHVDG